MVGVCENGNKSLGSFDDGKVVDKLCLSTFSGLQSTTDRNINVQKKKRPVMYIQMTQLGCIIAQTVSCWFLTGFDLRAVHVGSVVDKVALG